MRAIVVLLSFVLASTACQGAQVESPAISTGTSPSIATSSTDPSAEPSADASVEPTAIPSALVKFSKKIPDKQWGDPAFNAIATAASGANVKYSAKGCKIDPSSAKVTIGAVGTCTITATATLGDQTGQASVSFAIKPAHPVISFVALNVTFQRPFKAFPLRASSKPPIKLKYRVIPTGKDMDDFCAVTSSGALIFKRVPTLAKFPQLDGDCQVEVSAAETSSNYTTPQPRTRTIRVRKPVFDVQGQSRGPLTIAVETTVSMTILENSGDALGMRVEISNDPGGNCSDPSDPVASGRTKYTFTVKVKAGSYSCEFKAQAQPQDWQGDGFEDIFRLTVKP